MFYSFFNDFHSTKNFLNKKHNIIVVNALMQEKINKFQFIFYAFLAVIGFFHINITLICNKKIFFSDINNGDDWLFTFIFNFLNIFYN